MDDLDPKNPYGPNYEELSYNTKLYYKFNKVKKHVHFSEKDKNTLLNAHLKMFMATAGAFSLSLGIAYFMKARVFP